MQRVYSFRTLAMLWAALAGTAAAGTVALQASYMPPPPAPAAATLAPAGPVALAALPVPMPFENRSLLAALPPVPPPSALRLPAAVHPAAPLPIPPVPPAPAHRAPTRLAAQVAPRVLPEPVPSYREAGPWGPALAYGYGRGYGYGYGYAPRRAYYGWGG